MPSGDPREGKTPLGAVVDHKTVTHVNALIDDAIAKGAKVVSGGKAESMLMPATVVDKVTPNMRLYGEESFGPVVASDSRRPMRRTRSDSPTIPSTVCQRRFSRVIPPGVCAWRGRSAPGFATSTDPPCTMSRRCRSAASRIRVMADSAARRESMRSRSCAGSRSRRSRGISPYDLAAYGSADAAAVVWSRTSLPEAARNRPRASIAMPVSPMARDCVPTICRKMRKIGGLRNWGMKVAAVQKPIARPKTRCGTTATKAFKRAGTVKPTPRPAMASVTPVAQYPETKATPRNPAAGQQEANHRPPKPINPRERTGTRRTRRQAGGATG